MYIIECPSTHPLASCTRIGEPALRLSHVWCGARARARARIGDRAHTTPIDIWPLCVEHVHRGALAWARDLRWIRELSVECTRCADSRPTHIWESYLPRCCAVRRPKSRERGGYLCIV